MRRIKQKSIALIAWLVIVGQAHAAAMQDDIGSISVVADPGIAVPLTEIALAYTRQKHISVAVSYKPFSQQETEIAASEGAAYDVLITTRPKLLESLKQQGLVDIYSEVAIARNRLVLVAAAKDAFQLSFSGAFPLATLINYFNWQPGLLLGNPETLMEGSVARDALRYYDALQDLEPYIIYIRDMSDIVQMVSEEQKLAFIFESEARQNPRLRVVDVVPEQAHDPMTYTAVVLAGDKMNDARGFVDFLKQTKAQTMFETYYFRRP